MTEWVDIAAVKGRASKGALARPSGAGRGGVIVVHEWFGLNDDMCKLTDRFATEGFFALAVDLYEGRSTADSAEAMKLSSEMKTLEAMSVIEGAVEYLRHLEGCSGKVAVTGFCLGGAMAFAAAALVPHVSGAVPFYGIARDEYVDWTKVRVPIQAHFGKADPIIREERVHALAEKARAGGASLELHLYEAGHAFMRAGDAHAYHEPSAVLAWSRAIEFLHRTTD
jgi:carboxymethylenebutenolidase